MFLQERAAAEALAGNQETAKVLRRIKRAEATKVCFQLLHKYLKPSVRGGITQIEVENTDDGTTNKHFSQATGTPFTTSPLKEDLGSHGETQMGQAILNGRAKPKIGPNASFAETQIILDTLQPLDPPTKPVSINVTEKDINNFFLA
jgi:hypothetical protein